MGGKAFKVILSSAHASQRKKDHLIPRPPQSSTCSPFLTPMSLYSIAGNRKKAQSDLMELILSHELLTRPQSRGAITVTQEKYSETRRV